jgi:pyruvate, water dikinase
MASARIYSLDQVHSSNRSAIGEKAFYLGWLVGRGYPVLPGIVIPGSVFREFLETINWLEPLFADLPNSSLHVDVDNPRQLQAIAQQIRYSIQATPLEESWLANLVECVQPWLSAAVILRPSLSIKGNLDPSLKQKVTGLLNSQVCGVEAQAIAHSLKQVWAEVFRAKSLLYWQRLGIPLQRINLAILIQPIQSAIASGTVRISSTNIEIRATWGLGKGLEEGEVTPDLYQIQASTGQVLVQRISRKALAYQVVPSSTVELLVGEEQPIAPPILQSIALTQSAGWQAYSVESAKQEQAVLNSAQQERVVQLAQRVIQDLNMPLELAWTLHSPDQVVQSFSLKEDAEDLWITQLIPQFNEALLIREKSDRPSSAATGSAATGSAEKSDRPSSAATGSAATGSAATGSAAASSAETGSAETGSAAASSAAASSAERSDRSSVINPLPASLSASLSDANSLQSTSVASQIQKSGVLDSNSSVLNGLAAAPGRVCAYAWVLNDADLGTEIPPGVILVTSAIAPHRIPALQNVVGVITDQGGMTSHGAILAREFGIPAVVGTQYATHCIQSGMILQVDGDRGIVHLLSDAPSDNSSSTFSPSGTMESVKMESAAMESAAMESVTMTTSCQLSQLPRLSLAEMAVAEHSKTSSPPQTEPSFPESSLSQSLKTGLMVNISRRESLERVVHLAVDGIGLLRSELLLSSLLAQQSLSQWLQDRDRLVDSIASQIQPFAEVFAPRPVFYRSLDMRSHEISTASAFAPPTEQNPILGLHGTLSYQMNPTLFDLELAALYQLQQDGYTNIHLMLPFVRTVEEFIFCRQRTLDIGLLQNSNFQLWIMAEVPSVLFLLPDYVEAGVQGISIGSNDLTQLLLAVDRDHSQMAPAFNPCHPAVLRAMQQLIQTAKQLNIPTSMCGQAPVQYPELIEHLVQWGITTISVSPEAVEQTRRVIQGLGIKD